MKHELFFTYSLSMTLDYHTPLILPAML